MRKRRLPDEDIVEALADKGHSYQDISEALNQADIKSGVSGNNSSFSEFGQMEESSLSKAQPSADEDVPVPLPSQTVASEPSMPTSTVTMLPVQTAAPQGQSILTGDIQELIESVIEDRWQQVVASVGDISLWKGKVDDDLVSIKQEILRVEDRLGKLQAVLIGRVDDYNKTISKVGSEVAALEKVLEKIMEPMTSNIRELGRITQELKKR